MTEYGAAARKKLMQAMAWKLSGSGRDGYCNTTVDPVTETDALIIVGQRDNGRYYRFTLRLDEYGPDDD